MENKVQIVYVPVPVSGEPPKPRPREVYEFTCPYCCTVTEIQSLVGFRCACGHCWDEIVWEQPVVTDARTVLTCEDPDCDVHA